MTGLVGLGHDMVHLLKHSAVAPAVPWAFGLHLAG